MSVILHACMFCFVLVNASYKKVMNCKFSNLIKTIAVIVITDSYCQLKNTLLSGTNCNI